MCSTCDCKDVTREALSAIEEDHTKRCRKCGSHPFIILDKVHFECKQCFLESCHKKLRSTIGKSKLIRNNDPVLIAYSGGPSSCALLDLIKNSISSSNKREQKLVPSILHVDVQPLNMTKTNQYEQLLDDRSSKLKSKLADLSQAYPGWPIYWTTIETSMLLDDCNLNEIFAKYQDDSELDTTLLKNLDAYLSFQDQILDLDKDLTERQQLFQDLLGDLIDRVASAINQSFEPDNPKLRYIFKASSATGLANNLLVDVILGKGANICTTVNICDTRPNCDVTIMRPLREFSKKEIAYYLRARGIEPILEPNLLTFAERKSSIQTVTEAFLSKLYVDYPSTYNTLLRTGNKMQN